MDRLGRAGSIGPLAFLVLFTLLDLAAGPQRSVVGLLVIAPLLAASLSGLGLTIGYGVLTLAIAALMGVHDEQYTAEDWPAHAARLFGIALGAVIAVAACRTRLEREARLAQVSADAAEARERARGAERTAGLAETLQRSLLAAPPQLPRLEIAVRYLPAAEHVKIGGDWYDAFGAAGGRTVLVIGDVAGHDGDAATTMAQVRDVVRGIAQVLADPPAGQLTALDRALRTLNPGVLATMILAEVPAPAGPGDPVLRWSNAGHPPPLLVCAEGTARFLEHEPDLMLGVDPTTTRSEHQVALRDGDSLVLFTDGLVERRGSDIDEGLDRLVEAAGTVHGRSLEELCDALLDQAAGRSDDDVALLALRARPG